MGKGNGDDGLFPMLHTLYSPLPRLWGSSGYALDRHRHTKADWGIDDFQRPQRQRRAWGLPTLCHANPEEAWPSARSC